MDRVVPSHTPDQLHTLWTRVHELVTDAQWVPELKQAAAQLRPVVEHALKLCGMQNVPALTADLVRSFLVFIRAAGARADTSQWLEMYGPGY